MQRKKTNNTRAASADEKRFMAWVKDQPCCECGDTPVIVEHCKGSTYRHNRVLIGMWYLLPLCQSCDSVKTQGSWRVFTNKFGLMSLMWKRLIVDYDGQIPEEVIHSILDSNT